MTWTILPAGSLASMTLKTVLAPDALHRRDADADLLGHRRRRPMGRLARRLLQGSSNNRAGDLRAEWRNPRPARLVAQEPVHPFPHEPLLPAPDRVLVNTSLPFDLVRADRGRRQKDDSGPPNILLRAVPIRCDRLHPS